MAGPISDQYYLQFRSLSLPIVFNKQVKSPKHKQCQISITNYAVKTNNQTSTELNKQKNKRSETTVDENESSPMYGSRDFLFIRFDYDDILSDC